MKSQTKRTPISRAVGAGLVLGGLALGVAALAGSQAQHVTDNAQSQGWWINTYGVSTVGLTSVDTLPGGTSGNTVVGIPGTSIVVPGVDTSGNTVVGIPSIVVPGLDTSGNSVVGIPGPSIVVPGVDTSGNTVVGFPGGPIVTGSTFVF